MKGFGIAELEVLGMVISTCEAIMDATGHRLVGLRLIFLISGGISGSTDGDEINVWAYEGCLGYATDDATAKKQQ